LFHLRLNRDLKLNKTSFFSGNVSGRGLVWLGHRPSKYNLNIDWSKYKEYCYRKYASSWANPLFHYSRKYYHLLGDIKQIETFPPSTRTNILKSLVCLAKYLGIYLEFKNKLKEHGIKWKTNNNGLSVFLKLFNNNNSDVLEWYKSATSKLSDNEALYLKFVLLSGLRVREAQNSFNLIIKLANENRLKEYYNEKLTTLEHFRYKEFLRNTKNTYITIIPKELVLEIANSKPVYYSSINKHLRMNKLNLRIKELRSYYTSYMARHGLIQEEVDLLQGRVPKSIFVRHYLTIDFKQLAKRTLKALKQLEQAL